MRFVSELLQGAWSLIDGMAVTWRHMFKKPVTVLYPYQEQITPRFKGPIVFTRDEKSGDHRCIACNACIKTCPSRCMTLVPAKNAANKRIPITFTIDYTLCSLCSLCIEVCPTDALMHSDDYDMVSRNQRGMLMDLLEPFPKPQLAPPAPPSAP